ncbi:unnamed protein product [Pleuronectes platessa]|uniref:Uncharacterized protein n=1 Tax=Pleuronectes platessa TaxID=8262 RepID=A0A9N7V563_PLEPL|nr:unnamed protein product [Pleuronectes platessa]
MRLLLRRYAGTSALIQVRYSLYITTHEPRRLVLDEVSPRRGDGINEHCRSVTRRSCRVLLLLVCCGPCPGRQRSVRQAALRCSPRIDWTEAGGLLSPDLRSCLSCAVP